MKAYLSKDSEYLIQKLLDKNFFYLTSKSHPKIEKIKKIMFEDIKKSYTFTKKILVHNPIKPIIKNHKPDTMIRSSYVPKEIRDEIYNAYKWQLIYNVKIDGKLLKIIFVFVNE